MGFQGSCSFTMALNYFASRRKETLLPSAAASQEKLAMQGVPQPCALPFGRIGTGRSPTEPTHGAGSRQRKNDRSIFQPCAYVCSGHSGAVSSGVPHDCPFLEGFISWKSMEGGCSQSHAVPVTKSLPTLHTP